MNRSIKHLKLPLACIVVFIMTSWYLSYYKNMLYSLSADEGIFLYGAKRVLDGQIIYRDFFSYFFPGNYYLLALIYKLFGYSFLVAREALVIIDSFINVLVFYLSYKTLRAWYAVLPPLFFLILGFPNWMQFSHFWNGDLFLLLSLISLLWYLEKNKQNYLYTAAVLLGFTTLFQQAAGVYGVILCAVILLLTRHKEIIFPQPRTASSFSAEIRKGYSRVNGNPFFNNIYKNFFWIPTFVGMTENRRSLLYKPTFKDGGGTRSTKFIKDLILFFALASLPVAAMFGYIALKGGLGDFLQQQMFIVLNVYPNVAAFSPFLFIFNKAYPINILIGIYFFGSIAAAGVLPVLYKKISAPVIVTITGNLILLLTISYSLDVEHIATAMPLFLIMVLLPVKYLLSLAKSHRSYFYKPVYYLSGLAGVCLIIWGVSSIAGNINRIQTHKNEFDINGTKVWMFSKERAYTIKQFLHEEHKLIDNKKDVFVYPYAPLLYVFLGLNNPTHYDFIYIRLGIEGANAYVLHDIIRELQQRPVKYLIKHGWPEHYTRMLMSLKHITPYPTVLDEFVQSHYSALWTIGEYSILQIK